MAAHLLRWLPALLAAGFTAACASPTAVAPGPPLGRIVAGALRPPNRQPGPPSSLTGTPWVVVGLLSPDGAATAPALDQVRPTLTVTERGAVFGNAGCNRMTGSALVDPGDTGRAQIVFRVATTSRWCGAAVMAVEARVLRTVRGPVEATTGAATLTLCNRTERTGLALRAE